jgi:hypothetical protein|tara:strand:+ start:592 stop:807 length:216 start_codon:yes stop_codon:yes gene_type:complete
MGSISDQIEEEQQVENTRYQVDVEPQELSLSGDEIKFILAKVAQLDFKGVEIEFAYKLIVKLQDLYKKQVQ